MNLEQIVAKARYECGYEDSESIRVSVAARADNPAREAVFSVFADRHTKNGSRIRAASTGSFGLYDLEPIVVVQKPGQPAILYPSASAESAERILKAVLESDYSGSGLALCSIGEIGMDGIRPATELPLFQVQDRIALSNCGLTNPESVADYVARFEGYKGLAKALEIGRETVIEEVRASGLRDRNTAGYLTAEVWRAMADTEGEGKIVICNAVEAGPGAKTAELLLSSDPHIVLEGLLIAAYAAGASRAILCVGPEKGGEEVILRNVLEQMANYNLLNRNILDTDYSCSIELRTIAPPLLIAQEETAIIRALEGGQIMPCAPGNPPFLSNLKGEPAMVSNAETLASIPAIVKKGSRWFSAKGTKVGTGSRVITLLGTVIHGYTIEVPFGTMLRTIIDIGGVPEGRAVKAFQVGGLTGCFFGTEDRDAAIDFEMPSPSDAPMGSGTIEMVGDDVCAVEMTGAIMSHLQSQSCGKCVFCREGTFQIADILQGIERGGGNQEDLELITELANQMRTETICGFGRNAANPVLSSLRLFAHEYEAHIKGKKCPKTG